MKELSTLTPMQFILLSERRSSAWIWPPGSSRPVVLEGWRLSLADSPIHLCFSPSEIATAVTRDEELRRPDASQSLWGRLRPWPEYQRCMGLLAALALFGASTAYSSFTQVVSANDLIVAHFAGSLRVAFALFIACAIATFSIQLLPLNRSRTFAFFIMGLDIIFLGMGCLHLTMPLLTTAPEDSRWRAFAGVLALLFSAPIATTAVAAGISAFQMINLKAQRACDRAAARPPAGDADAAQAAAFLLRTYDLYGGAVGYLLQAFPGGEKPDAADFCDVLEAFLPAGAAYSQEADAASAGVHAFLRDAGRWYAVAEELRRRALHPHAAPPPLHERVRGLLILEKAFLRHALGKQTSSERSASPARMDEETPPSPPETPHVAIEVTEPDGQDQGSNPSRLNENLPPA